MSVSASDTIRLLGARETQQRNELTSAHDVAFCGDLSVAASPEGCGRNSQLGRLALYRVAEPKAGTLVFAVGGQTVQAIDVSNPDALAELSRFTSEEVFSGGMDDAHDLVFHDGHLFVTAQNTHALVVLRVEHRKSSP